MRPLASVTGTPLHAVDAALELEPAHAPRPCTKSMTSLRPPNAGGARVHHLDLPALRLRVLGVHARELGGEQRRLVAAGAGADLDEDVSCRRCDPWGGRASSARLRARSGARTARRSRSAPARPARDRRLVPGCAGPRRPLEDILGTRRLLDDSGMSSVLFAQARVLGLLARSRDRRERARSDASALRFWRSLSNNMA